MELSHKLKNAIVKNHPVPTPITKHQIDRFRQDVPEHYEELIDQIAAGFFKVVND